MGFDEYSCFKYALTIDHLETSQCVHREKKCLQFMEVTIMTSPLWLSLSTLLSQLFSP